MGASCRAPDMIEAEGLGAVEVDRRRLHQRAAELRYLVRLAEHALLGGAIKRIL